MCLGSAFDILGAGQPPRATFVDYPLGHSAGKRFDAADQAGFPAAEMATERGLAYDLIGDNTAAQRHYQLALASGPRELGQSDEASRRYALSLVIGGDRRGAEQVIQPLLERRDRGAWRVRTFIMAIAGQSDEAEGIARATLPVELAASISPYLRYMPRLTPAQQAAAANLGRFPRAADIGRDEKKVLRKIFRKICPLIDLLNGNNQCVSGGDGIDGHEHHTEIIAISESCRQFSIDDLGKKCWHGATISCSDDGLWRRNRD
jgi:hypothetical protein